jgi:hypothetical protein
MGRQDRTRQDKTRQEDTEDMQVRQHGFDARYVSATKQQVHLLNPKGITSDIF